MEKRWDKVVIHQNNISFERDLNKSICPDWKYLIRKFHNLPSFFVKILKEVCRSNT